MRELAQYFFYFINLFGWGWAQKTTRKIKENQNSKIAWLLEDRGHVAEIDKLMKLQKTM